MMLLFIILFMTIFCNAFTQFTDKEATIDSISHPDRFVFRNICYNSLDDKCFSNGPPYFHPIYRPLSAIPDEALNVKFLLFTPSNPKEKFDLQSNEASLEQSPFNCGATTIFLTHGFMPNFDPFWKMKDALLEINSYNVIVNDWQEHAKPPYYQAVANTRTVGARVAKLIQLIWEKCKTNGSTIYLIGHSLGAQVSGYIGKLLPGIKRITGLDPAGPYFQGLDKETHLNAGDADYVDIIHTNAADFITKFGLGYLKPLGDVDFFVNDGTNQLGCNLVDAFLIPKVLNMTELSAMVACSHERANEICLESIKNSGCKFTAVRCDSFEDFENEKCSVEGSTIATFDPLAEKISGVPLHTTFYFRTNKAVPYCAPDGNKPEPKPITTPSESFFG